MARRIRRGGIGEEMLIQTLVKLAAVTGMVQRKPARAVHVGLIGAGIQKSRTPAMHEAEGAAHGLKYSYRLFDTGLVQPDTPPLTEIIRAAEICGYAGLNITYPYKVEVIDHLDELSDAAAMAGAVNTVVLRDGKRRGHNTDLWGFTESFRRSMSDVERDNVLLVGAGGAGAAVAHALAGCGVQTLHIADAENDRAEALVRMVCEKHGPQRATVAHDIATTTGLVDGIVNATPVGMAQVPGMPVPENLIRPPLWIADIIYFPLETELLRIARERGCRTLSGAGMAVFQAVRAFELFTGLKPDETRMKATFEAFDLAAPE